LNASTLLNYFLKEMFFWKFHQLNNNMAVYIAFITDNLFVFYPGRKKN